MKDEDFCRNLDLSSRTWDLSMKVHSWPGNSSLTKQFQLKVHSFWKFQLYRMVVVSGWSDEDRVIRLKRPEKSSKWTLSWDCHSKYNKDWNRVLYFKANTTATELTSTDASTRQWSKLTDEDYVIWLKAAEIGSKWTQSWGYFVRLRIWNDYTALQDKWMGINAKKSVFPLLENEFGETC